MATPSTTTTIVMPQQHGKFVPSPAGRSARFAVLGGILALLLAMPHIVPDVKVSFVALAAIYAMVALSMNLLMGYAGQVSLGHAAFYGIGAFISGVAVSDGALPFGVGLALGAVSGAVAAVLLGAIALRLSGLFLALVTIAYASVAEQSLFRLGFFKGGAGVFAPRPGFLESDINYTYFIYILLGVLLYLDYRLVGSKGGRAIQALRDDERVAASWGINVTQFKLLAFTLSGVVAGLAGALFAHLITVVDSGEFPALTLSLTFVLMTVVGGLGNRWGVIQGGVIFAVLGPLLESAHERFDFFPFSVIQATWEPAIGAALLVLTLIFFPGGIAQQQEPILNWLSFKRFGHAGHEGGVVAASGGESGRP